MAMPARRPAPPPPTIRISWDKTSIRLLLDDFYMNFPVSRPVKFTEKNRLPRAEGRLTLINHDLYRGTNDACLDVCRRIPFCMEIGALQGYQLIQLVNKVPHHVRIGPFIYRNSCSRMGNKYRT